VGGSFFLIPNHSKEEECLAWIREYVIFKAEEE